MMISDYNIGDFLKTIHWNQSPRILNAGSSSTRYGPNCVNVDIQDKANVDIVADIGNLPESIGQFDIIICNAVLQYCDNPFEVAKQFMKVLKPNGMLFVEAPFVQGYCPDTPDKFRFSEDGLRTVFKDFNIVKSGYSLRPGSAFAYLGQQIMEDLTGNRWVNHAATIAAKLLLYPFSFTKTKLPSKMAGSVHIVARKMVSNYETK